MQWSTFTSSQNGLLTFNGPYLIHITGCPIANIQRPQIIQLIKPIEVGEITIYGTTVAVEGNEEKKDLMDVEQGNISVGDQGNRI